MIGTIIGLLILLALVVLFGWLAMRAWGSQRAWLKWLGVILSGLLTLVFLLLFVVALIGTFKLYAPASNPVAQVKVAGTPEQIKRGEKFANFCAGCHSASGNLPLDGSKANFVEEGPPVGTVFASNLTPAGELKDWSDGEIIRALREGVHKSGRPLIIMPSNIFRNLSDADAQAIVAYLRSQPATKNNPGADAPANQLNLLGALFVGAGMFPTATQPPITQPVVAPPAGTSGEYGKYLVSVLGCHECHGEDLAGIAPSDFGPPAGPNLTVLMPKWSEAEFMKTIRTGTDPTGHALNPKEMPWKEISTFATDDELKAIFAYLKALTPITKPAK